MFYCVTAKLKPDTAADYLAKLTDGSIRRQPPDGGEIADAMNQAVMTEDGNVLWSMGCFCSTPLAHERETVFDKYFDDMDIQPTNGRQSYEGPSFMEHLAALVNTKGDKPHG